MNNPLTRLTFLILLLVAPFHGVGADNPVLKSTPTLTLKLASRMMEVAVRRAEELKASVVIVIVGTDGAPLTIRRNENCPGVLYEQALQSARTAWLDKTETGGGIPLLLSRQRVGGIGVSGSLPEKNREIGKTALDIFTQALQKKFPIQRSTKELLKIILYVRASEIDETAEFYKKAIGLPQLTAFSDWKEFDAGPVTLCLHEKDKSSPRDKATNFALYSGTREQVAALHARLIEDGYKVTSDINPEHDKTMGRLRHEETMTTFWIKDPAGNTIQIESLRTN